MKQGKLVFALLICLFILAGFDSLLAETIDKGNEELRLYARNIVKNYNRCLEKEGFGYKLRIGGEYKYRRGFHEKFKNVTMIKDADRKYTIDVIKNPIQIVGFSNHFAQGNTALFDKPTEPVWSKEKAEDVSREFVKCLIGQFPKNFKLYKAVYRHPYMEMEKYYVGQWYVAWVQTDKYGNEENSIIVLIYEQYGPSSIGINYRMESD